MKKIIDLKINNLIIIIVGTCLIGIAVIITINISNKLIYDKILRTETNEKIKGETGTDDIEIQDLQQLLDQSDYVLHIIPKKVRTENKYIKFVEADVLKEYKSRVNDDKYDNFEFALPKDIDINNEYIVFMKSKGNLLVITARNGSIIAKNDTDKWNEIVKWLEHINDVR